MGAILQSLQAILTALRRDTALFRSPYGAISLAGFLQYKQGLSWADLKTVMGRVGPRPMICGLCMGRSALLMRWPTCFHGPARVAVHDMSCTIVSDASTSTSARRLFACAGLLLSARAIFHSASWGWRKFCDQTLGAVLGADGALLAVSAAQAAFGIAALQQSSARTEPPV